MRALVLVMVVVATLVFAGCASSKQSAGQTTSEIMVKAVNAQSSGNPTLASHYFNDVLERDPANKLAYYNLGVIAQGQERYIEAADNFRVALRLDPNFALARSSLDKVESLKTTQTSGG